MTRRPQPPLIGRRLRSTCRARPRPMQLAALRLASVEAERKNFAAAQQQLAASGLSPEQCSLIDLEPAVEFGGITASDYPTDLNRMGFGGQSKIVFDITSEGRTQDPRIVYAFPPFVFDPTVEKGATRLRFNRIFREGGTIGCANATQSYRFETGY